MSDDATPIPPAMALEPASPNWDAIEEEIRCPLCDYHLRGLVEPRCPECGFRFVWADLIDPSRRLHPYLFEHHPERRWWSFRRTLVSSLGPRRFWLSLHPAQPSNAGRLLQYLFFISLPFILLPVVNLTGICIGMIRANAMARASEAAILAKPAYAELAQEAIQQYGSIQAYLDAYYPVDRISVLREAMSSANTLMVIGLPSAVALAWPWATIAGLLVFQISMRRARVRSIHVVRCVAYSSDIIFWLGLLALAGALVLATLFAGPSSFFMVMLHNSEVGLMLAAGLIFLYRLWIAYHTYLRFRHSAGVVLSSQIIAALLVLNLGMLLVWM